MKHTHASASINTVMTGRHDPSKPVDNFENKNLITSLLGKVLDELTILID
jgi:hypothetical protein